MRTSERGRRKFGDGFTLIELLVVMAIVAILAALGISVISRVQSRTKAAQCASNLRTLGQAILLYSTDHEGEFPRSWHSAGAYREPGWAASIAPYLGVDRDTMEESWPEVFNRYYRSPADYETNPFIFSYALNVYFEVQPGGDDYRGSPQQWRRLAQVPRPARTVLLAQSRPVMFGDHLMCHQWSGINAARNALNHEIHSGTSNVLFVDGHVEALPVEAIFDPSQGVDLFHPEGASD